MDTLPTTETFCLVTTWDLIWQDRKYIEGLTRKQQQETNTNKREPYNEAMEGDVTDKTQAQQANTYAHVTLAPQKWR